MYVYEIKLMDMGRNGHRFFVLFGCNYATIDELTKELQEHTIVSGERLIWHRARDEIVVDETTPLALTRNAIYSIDLPKNSVVRYQDG